jgi:hypothetical protein
MFKITTGEAPIRGRPAWKGGGGTDSAPNLSMLSVLLGLVAITGASLGVIAVALHRAPEAYEDEKGLNILRKRAGGTGVSRKRAARQGHPGALREARSHSSA